MYGPLDEPISLREVNQRRYLMFFTYFRSMVLISGACLGMAVQVYSSCASTALLHAIRSFTRSRLTLPAASPKSVQFSSLFEA